MTCFRFNAASVLAALVAVLVMAEAPGLDCVADDTKTADVEWPEFRGPGGQGHSPAVGLPVTWSEKDNIAWKVAIPGRGWSSPVIRGEQIWLTTADSDQKTLRALCLDRQSGTIRQNIVISTPIEAGTVHKKN